MRLIDADNLKIPNDAPYKASVKRVVAQQPTVEAIPVQVLTDAILEKTKIVHCKDCTHWGTGLVAETERVKCCEFAKWMIGENGYCFYGNMRTSAE